jgi:4-hydroxy-2-oxoheptanedioate aldolase
VPGAAVPDMTGGVDGLFIGPNDLAASMGYLGDSQHPVVQAAVDDAFERLRALDVVTGYPTTDEAPSQAGPT